MNRLILESLLPRGTKTWQNAMHATTIDLMLVSQELASDVLKCKIHDMEHGSDHRAIETSFDVEVTDHTTQPRLLFKNAPWNAMRDCIAQALHDRPACGGVQRQADRLMQVVLKAVNTLTPRAKPLPYAKCWLTRDLTKLRQVYTHWKNRARAQRRGGEALPELEQQARAAAKETTTRYASNRDCTGTSSWWKTPTSGRPVATSSPTTGRGGQGSRLYERRTGQERRTSRSRPSSCSLPFSRPYPET
jgi:hypothetical protein